MTTTDNLPPQIKTWRERLYDLDRWGRPFERDIESADAEITDLRAALAQQAERIAELEEALREAICTIEELGGKDNSCDPSPNIQHLKDKL